MNKKEQDEKTTYQSSEHTLREIGQELGGVTPAMVKKLSYSAEKKIRSLCGNSTLSNMGNEDLEQLNLNILNLRKTVSEKYGEILLDVKDVDEFYKQLRKHRFISKGDVQYIQDEKKSWSLLKTKTDSKIQISNVLLSDIEKDDNQFKAFQYGVSRKMFPRVRTNKSKKNEQQLET